MPRQGNYSFVIDSHFKPFSMEELLMPFLMYKEQYDEAQEAYDELHDADVFSYLSKAVPEGSESKQIYENYANDLHKYSKELSQIGLTSGNRRNLSSLKRRYKGEIGMLEEADKALKEELKLRREQGPSMIFAEDNLNMDMFLPGRNPNLYGVNSDDLYARGEAAGKAASMRVFSAGDAGSTLGGYYRDYVQRMGYGPETIQRFYRDMSAIPELQMAADSILGEMGVTQNLDKNSNAYLRAKQSVLNGMIAGAMYKEDHNPVVDRGVMSASEAADNARANMRLALEMAQAGKEKSGSSKGSSKSGSGSSSSSGSKGTERLTQLKEGIRFSWKGNNPVNDDGSASDAWNDKEETPIKSDNDKYEAPLIDDLNSLPQAIRDKIDDAIGYGNEYLYDIRYKPFKEGALGGIWDDTEAVLEIIPRNVVTFNADDEEIPSDLH